MHAALLLRETRRRHRLNQQQLARRARTGQGQISKIERGVISPSVATLARLLEVMGERLELVAVAGPRPNVSVAELRRDYELPVEERLAQQAALSEALTRLALTPRDE
jgi:transcriptional regulator with XRE-family HTH domain